MDTTTMTGKLVCGYQGWFRCEGDGSKNGWFHYAAGGPLDPAHVAVEMWPDVGEIPESDRVATPFKNADGSTAQVFSSVSESVARLHFQWMREYGIDGAMIQRFATTSRDPRYCGPMDTVLAHCRAAAQANGRGWAVMYDLSGLQPGSGPVVQNDWKRLVREKRVVRDGSDASYFRHHGKPLVALWGLGFKDRAPMLEEWGALIDFLRDDSECGGCAIMLGVPYHWRTQEADCIKDEGLNALLAKADIISPWAVGRLATPEDAAGRVETRLKPDLARAAELKADYLPVVFPGFSWRNLWKTRGKDKKFNATPRRGGEFLWAQVQAAKSAGASMLYVAMFDEMDEGTAIFKTSQTPPAGDVQFLSEPGLPSDHYLWLTGQAARVIRGELPVSPKLPVRQGKADGAEK